MLLHLLDYGWLVPAYTVVGPGVHSFHIPVLGVTVHCKIELDPFRTFVFGKCRGNAPNCDSSLVSPTSRWAMQLCFLALCRSPKRSVKRKQD